jgi:hypothetical protein
MRLEWSEAAKQRDGEQGNSWFAWGKSAHKRADDEWTKRGETMKNKLPEDTHKQEGAMYKKRGKCRDVAFLFFLSFSFVSFRVFLLNFVKRQQQQHSKSKKRHNSNCSLVHREEEK